MLSRSYLDKERKDISIVKWIKRITITILLLILLGIGLYLYSRYIEPFLLVTVNYTKEVPSDVKETKIVFFTDTHFGKYYDDSNLEKIVEKINAAEPDIVVFGGDFFDDYARDKDLLDIDSITKQLSAIEAKYAKIAVYGNHDYGGGAQWIYKSVLEDGGFLILRNDTLFLEELNFEIVGLDDHMFGSIDEELYQLSEDKFHLAITHEPDVADHFFAQGENLLLAGHSHGGQVKLPFLTEKVLPAGAKKYVDGEYIIEKEGASKETNLYVSSGIGMTNMPYRFMNIPEIVVITLQPGN